MCHKKKKTNKKTNRPPNINEVYIEKFIIKIILCDFAYKINFYVKERIFGCLGDVSFLGILFSTEERRTSLLLFQQKKERKKN